LTQHLVRIPSVEAVVGDHPANQLPIGDARRVFQGTGATDGHDEVLALETRPLESPSLDQVEADGRRRWIFDGDATDFTVALAGMRVADEQARALRTYRQVGDAPRPHVGQVHI